MKPIDPPADAERVMWIAIRRALLAAAKAIELRYRLGDDKELPDRRKAA